MSSQPTGVRDRALIVTSRAMEYAAVRSHLANAEEKVSPDGTVYDVGSFASWEVVVLDAYHPWTAGVLDRELDRLSPQLVLLVGAASGVGRASPGDVVAAREVLCFDASFLALDDLDTADYALVQRAGAEARKGDWVKRVKRDGPSNRALVAMVAVPNKEVDLERSAIGELVSMKPSQFAAVELERAALTRDLTLSLPAPGLVIRGITDHLTKPDLEPVAPAIAADRAAAFAFEILAELARNRIGWDSHPAIPREPVELRSLRVKNLRLFEDFALELRPRPTDAGQWTVLLGDNGVGKTTILRALVFALADPRLANSFFQLGGTSAPYLRDGGGEAVVALSLARQSYQARITREGQDVERLTKHGTEPPLPLYAYGCQRGTALGGAAREVEFRPLDDVRSLFDDAASLIHAETWLQKLRLAALESAGGPAEAFFDAVRDTVVAILAGVERLEVDKDGVRLAGPNVGRAPLAALSDGYITTAGWLLDLIARWSHRCQRAGIELDRDFRSQMTALVLIDEIDLHLHPLWQVEIISTVREQFPRLSVVATTHNPLTLLGAREGEIHVLRREGEDGRIVAHQRDVPAGARADQVLTGDWFGLASTVDHDTLALLAEHRTLLRQQVSASDPRRQELERTLRHRLGTFADTAVDRLVQSIAAQLIGDEYEELTPEGRRAIRDKIRQRAKERAA